MLIFKFEKSLLFSKDWRRVFCVILVDNLWWMYGPKMTPILSETLLFFPFIVPDSRRLPSQKIRWSLRIYYPLERMLFPKRKTWLRRQCWVKYQMIFNICLPKSTIYSILTWKLVRTWPIRIIMPEKGWFLVVFPGAKILMFKITFPLKSDSFYAFWKFGALIH